MVDVKIDLSKKTKSEAMALVRDLSHYAHIISIDEEIANFRKTLNYDRKEHNTMYAIRKLNDCIVKYCEGNYIDEPISMDELEEICE